MAEQTPTTAAELIGEVFDASLLTPELDGTLILPGWLTITCPTLQRSAQDSASTVVTGFGANTARAFSRDGVSFGLLIEPGATNDISEQNFNGAGAWTDVGTPVLTTATSPDGDVESVELEDDDAGVIEAKTRAITGLATGRYTVSAWSQYLGAAGTIGARVPLLSGITPTLDVTVNGADADWTYRSDSDTLTVITSPLVEFIPRDTAVADVGSARMWGMQGEQRAYPTSFQGADNATFTRAADVLSAASDVIAPAGLFDIVLRYRPHYSETEITSGGEHNLIFFDANNRLFFRESSATFVLELDGVELASAAVTFARHDELTITAKHTLLGRTLIVAGATTGNGTTEAAAVDPMTEIPMVAYVLGGPTGAEEGADLTAMIPNLITFATLADDRALVQMDDAPGSRAFRDTLQALAAQPGHFRDVAFQIKSAFELQTGVGDQLDKIGAVVGLTREGFTDTRYRVFLEIQIELLLSASRTDAEWTGTIPNIIRIARKFIGTGVADPVVYTGYPPYSYVLQVPGLILSEAGLLARFLTTANYAAVRGLLIVIISADSLWESNVAPITDGGVWESNVAPIAGASEWQIVVKT